jgi:signal transduction histidine kinase
MPGRHTQVLPRRRPLRLILAVALPAGILAAGGFLLVRERRLDASAEQAVEKARSQLEFAAQNLPPAPEPDDLGGVVDALSGLDFEIVIVDPQGSTRGSLLTIGVQEVPPDLRDLVQDGLLAYQRATVGDTRYLIVGGPASTSELYLFFSEAELHAAISVLAFALMAGWAAIVGLTVAAAVAVLQSRLAAVAETRARERRFTSDVAHELRTPLTALVAEASLLQDHLDRIPPEARRPAELLVQDVGRLRRLVEELMEISKLDAGGDDMLLEPVDFPALVRAVLRARGWESRVRVEGPPLVIESDRRRLERIAANLIGNALEHGGRDVSVRTSREGDRAFLEVSDRGPGISSEALPYIFERFYKGDPSRSGRGTGLGLAIARENARLLGGDIVVESEPGEGSRFVVRLPLTAAAS